MMHTIMDLCFLCTKDYNCVPVDNNIVSQVEYLLPEITIFKLGIPLRICSVCEGALDAFGKFKHSSVESSRRLESSIRARGAPGPPLHTGRAPVVGHNDTSDTQPEKIEAVYIKEEPVEETWPECHPHINSASLNPALQVDRTSLHDYSSIQLHKPQSQMQEDTDVNSHKAEEISVNINKRKQISQSQDCYNNVKEEYYERIDTKDDITNCETNETFVPKYKIQESFTHEEHLEKQPSLGKDIKNNQTENKTQDESNTLNINDIKTTEIQIPNSYNSEEISIKEEHLTSPQDTEMYNKMLQTILIEGTTDNKPERNFENDNTTRNTREEMWNDSSSDLEEEIIVGIDENFKNIDTDKKKEHRCNICNEVFLYNALLIRHMKKIHWRIKNLPCDICKKRFIHKYDLNRHMELHNGMKNKPKYFLCKICNRTFTSEAYFTNHIKKHSKTQKSLSCSTCNKSFKYKTDLDRHLKSHSDVRDFECDICNRSFKFMSNLDRHMNIHNTLNGFKCHICSKSYMLKHDLITHMKSHSAVKDFLCNICSESFSLKSDLSSHMKIHCDAKALTCTICDKSFKEYSVLSAHMKLHCDIKETQCHICNKQFSCKSKVDLHVKSHYGIKDFHCTMCSKTFKQKCGLDYHMKSHLGIKEYQCDLCNKAYVTKGQLVRHKKQHYE